MPLHSEPSRVRFDEEMSRRNTISYRRVDLPGEWFGPGPDPETDVLFRPLGGGDRCAFLVAADIRYTGADPDLVEAFDNPDVRGWRPLAVVKSLNGAQVLSFADAVLGLTGAPPHVPRVAPTRPRELVVDTEDLSEDAESKDPAERFGADLVEEARAGRLEKPLYREPETEALIRILSKAGKNAACLVGEPGTGKTAVVEGLACAVAENRVPPALQGVRIRDVNLTFLGAGASMRGEFEARVKELVELARQDRKTILFLDEFHTIRAPSNDASQMLKSDLGRGRIACIGATTTAEYRQIEADGALARRFQVVRVEELGRTEATEILRERKTAVERHHGVEVPDELIEQIIELAQRFVPDRRLPDKALDLLDEACACAAISSAAKEDTP